MTARYSIEVSAAAVRSLRKLDPQTALRIQGVIAALAVDPRPPAAEPLRGRPQWRVRVGDYRVLYAIDDGRLVVLVVAPGHRREIYR